MAGNPDRARGEGKFRESELRNWQRYGPILYRLQQLFFMAVTLGVAYVLALVYLTVNSLYPGSGSVRPLGPTERSVQAVIQECSRVGPVSHHGIGYWWVCQVSVQRDGAQIQASVDRSIAGPQDVGTVITLREACGERELGNCSYGRPVAEIWSFLYGVLWLLGRALAVVLLAMVAIYLLKAIVGAPFYFSMLDRWRGVKGTT
ncbi:DUF6346 domain-containing protein [Micromonospora sp. WMMA1363]|uniref:DUF6346 domain-containing protein n=1 Tax=Micromonospora sp. WMMA1363 TaxID=3053985 RepID=UPI00338F688C